METEKATDVCEGCQKRDQVLTALAIRVRQLEEKLKTLDRGYRPNNDTATLKVAQTPPPERKESTRIVMAPRIGTPVAKPAAAETKDAPKDAPIKIDADTKKLLEGLGFPEEDLQEAARALREHSSGLNLIAPFAAKQIHGNVIYHAAFAGEKFGKEAVEAAVKLAVAHALEGSDVFHTADAVKSASAELAEVACEMGFRKRDVIFAAKALELWPNLKEARKAIEELKSLFADKKVDVHEEDIRYSAVTLRNLGKDLLERALRERHPKNNRENWLRGVSIPLVAFAYRLDAPHTGAAIDEANKRSMRREKIGVAVIAALARKRGKEIEMPNWL